MCVCVYVCAYANHDDEFALGSLKSSFIIDLYLLLEIKASTNEFISIFMYVFILFTYLFIYLSFVYNMWLFRHVSVV